LRWVFRVIIRDQLSRTGGIGAASAEFEWWGRSQRDVARRRAQGPDPWGRIDVPHLIIETDGLAAGPVTLKDELTIGRAEDNDLELLDPKVSRHHARIARQGTQYVVTDLGSANGTLVDGVP